MRCKLVSQFILLRICLGLGPGPSRPLASAAVARSRNTSAGYLSPGPLLLHACHHRTAHRLRRCLSSLRRCPHPCPCLLLVLLCRAAVQVKSSMRAVSVSFVLSIVLCHNPLQGRSKKKLGLVSILEICGSDKPLLPKEAVGLPLRRSQD